MKKKEEEKEENYKLWKIEKKKGEVEVKDKRKKEIESIEG